MAELDENEDADIQELIKGSQKHNLGDDLDFEDNLMGGGRKQNGLY